MLEKIPLMFIFDVKKYLALAEAGIVRSDIVLSACCWALTPET